MAKGNSGCSSYAAGMTDDMLDPNRLTAQPHCGRQLRRALLPGYSQFLFRNCQ